MAQQIQFRRGTAALWTSTNPILGQGEPGLETDTNKVKVGDGTTVWSSLPYSAGPTVLFTSAAAGGDLSGTLPSPTVAKVNGVAVTGTPSSGQVLAATGSSAAQWSNAAVVVDGGNATSTFAPVPVGPSYMSTAQIAADPALIGAYAQVAAIFGVDATGATDVYTSVQAQVTAAGTGALVWWPKGTYAVSAAVAPLDGQYWDGPGVLKAHSSNTTSVVAVTGNTGVTINVAVDGGLASTLTGNSGNASTVRHGVNITSGSTDCAVIKKVSNVAGAAVRIYDSHRCTSRADIYNAYYGVIIGSGGSDSDPSGGAHYNKVERCTIRVTGKNAIFITGNTSSTANPNAMLNNRVTGVTIGKVGDTGIEIGEGSLNTAVSGVLIDGTEGDATWASSGAYNGILVRDSSGHAISGFVIKNFYSFTNGNGVLLTLGNGIYVWPQYTGTMQNLAIGNGIISNCTRGVFAQGNQSAIVTGDGFVGGIGTAGVVYGDCTVTGVVVDGTQLGNLSGSYSSFLDSIQSHGFYIQSVAGWTLTGCVAKSCQNDGFRVGDTNTSSAYALDVSLQACRARNNGQQARSGITYSGFYLNGTSNQQRVYLNGCRANDTQSSGSKTQHAGYRWNSTGGQPGMADCRANGHSGTYTNSGSGSSFNGVGTDNYGAFGGSMTITGGTVASINQDVSTIIWNGTTAQSVNLPSASFSGSNRTIRVRNVGTVALTISKSGGGTLAKTSVAASEDYTYITDGTNWY